MLPLPLCCTLCAEVGRLIGTARLPVVVVTAVVIRCTSSSVTRCCCCCCNEGESGDDVSETTSSTSACHEATTDAAAFAKAGEGGRLILPPPLDAAPTTRVADVKRTLVADLVRSTIEFARGPGLGVFPLELEAAAAAAAETAPFDGDDEFAAVDRGVNFFCCDDGVDVSTSFVILI